MGAKTNVLLKDKENHQLSDQIRTGNVGKGSAVAAGRGATASVINVIFNLLPVVVVLLAIIGVLAYLLMAPTPQPEEMKGLFNIAVAEFIVVNQDGVPVKSNQGKKLADFLYKNLENSLQEIAPIGAVHDLWPPEFTGQIRNETNAKELSEEINADVIIYGVIVQSGNRLEFSPKFYINSDGFQTGAEIIGEHELGTPLILNLNSEYRNSEELTNRLKALIYTVIGLSDLSYNHFEHARTSFSKAEERVENQKGKEIVYLLLGNADLGQASTNMQLDESLMMKASDYYSKALSINPKYSRAMLGQAIVLYRLGIGDLKKTDDQTDLALLDKAVEAYQKARRLDYKPENANVDIKIDFGLGLVELARALAVEDDENYNFSSAQSKFEEVIKAAAKDEKNKHTADLAGLAYANLGLIAIVEGDLNLATEHYQKAADLVIDREKSEYYFQLGDLYIRTNKPEFAEDVLDQCIDNATEHNNQDNVQLCSERKNQLVLIFG